MTNTKKNTNNNQNDAINFLNNIQAMFNATGIGQDLQKALADADKIVKKDSKK